MNPQRYVRSLSAGERYSLALDEIYRYHVDGVIEGVGRVDPAQLQSAVDRAAAHNPGIRVRMRGILAFSKWVDSGIAPRVRVLPLCDWDGSSERGAAFLLEPLDALRGGPVADVLVVPCTDGRTRLVFRTLHAAVDGHGLLHWANEVFRVLRGETPRGSDSRLLESDVQARYRDRIVEEPAAAVGACIPVLQPAESPQRPLQYVWRRAVIDNRVSQLLPKTAVFLAAWARRDARRGDVGFSIPIDYRGRRTREMSIGNLTGFMHLDVPEGATPGDLMRRLTRRVRGFGDCVQPAGIKSLLWRPIWLMALRLRQQIDSLLYTPTPRSPSGGIVSMGNLDLAAYSFPGFQGQIVYGIPAAVGRMNVVFLNLSGRVVVTFSTPAAYNDCGQLDALVSAYQRYFSHASPVGRRTPLAANHE